MTRRRQQQLELPGAAELLPVQEAAWFPLFCAALETMSASLSESTIRSYQRALSTWRKFCRDFGEPSPMPPRPEAVVSWLEWMELQGLEVATIELRLSGLAWADAWARKGAPGPASKLTDDPYIRAWRRGHRRRRSIAQRQARAPTQSELELMVNACYAPLTGRGGRMPTEMVASRDHAALLVCYFGAMRRSELTALRVADFDLKQGALEVWFARSKTDQHGRGEHRALFPQSRRALCPVAAWERWMELYRPPDSSLPAFPSFERNQLIATRRHMHPDNWYQKVKRLCRDAGIPETSPHGLRAALVTHAALAGRQEGDVAHHARMRSRATLDRYTRRTKTWQNNPTSGLAVGATQIPSKSGSSDLPLNGGPKT